MKTILREEDNAYAVKPKDEKPGAINTKNLLDLNPNPVGETTNITNTNTNSQLKLLMDGKYVAPKKPEPVVNVLKKKFKVNAEDLPSL